LFRLVTLQPSRSTLVPYTTLFRSIGMVHRPEAVRLPVGVARHLTVLEADEGEARHRVAGGAAAFAGRHHDHPPGTPAVPSLWRGDRKSTRLNSSHVKISYAVFCLK